jgi:hypothetical protein
MHTRQVPPRTTRRRWRWPAAGPALLAALLLLADFPAGGQAAEGRAMPEFANQSPAVWINSAPLRRAHLKGKVVLIEIWTSI